MRTILHADCNCFYANVEMLYHPELRNVPMAVTGDAEKRHGIILAKNDPAKKYGIQTGMALWEAKQKCPDIQFVSARLDKYLQVSRHVQEIFGEFTEQVEPFGLDECWLDVSGSGNLFGDGKAIADRLRYLIHKELGITISVGIADNKIFAKLGSDMQKPNATTVITRDNYKDVVWPLPVSDLLYIGRATSRKLIDRNILTIGALAQLPPKYLRDWFGVIGNMLWTFANGADLSPVTKLGHHCPIKSIGNSTTTPRDLVTEDDIKITLLALSESVAARLRENSFVCNTIQLSVRDNGLSWYQRQKKLSCDTCGTQDIYKAALQIFNSNRPGRPIRLFGIRATGLSFQSEYMQLSFLPEDIESINQMYLDKSIDSIRFRYGRYAVRRGLALLHDELDIDAKADHTVHPPNFLGATG